MTMRFGACLLLALMLLAAGTSTMWHGTAQAAHDEPAPLRLAFLGDSLTYGLHASTQDHIYRAILGRRILAGNPQGLTVSEFQDPFGLTDDALRRVSSVVGVSPDVVILEIGNHEVFAGGAEVERFPALYDDLLGHLQATGAVVIAGTVAWLNYPADSREFADALRINAAIRRLCARRGIAVADLWTPTVFRSDMISQPGQMSFVDPYEGDDLHPNDAGHKALADAFWDAYRRDRARRALVGLR
jgi:acyl-CoA thioesterase-1